MPDVNPSDLRIREAVTYGLGEAMRKACPVDPAASLPDAWLELLAQIETAAKAR